MCRNEKIHSNQTRSGMNITCMRTVQYIPPRPSTMILHALTAVAALCLVVLEKRLPLIYICWLFVPFTNPYYSFHLNLKWAGNEMVHCTQIPFFIPCAYHDACDMHVIRYFASNTGAWNVACQIMALDIHPIKSDADCTCLIYITYSKFSQIMSVQ